MNLTDNYVIVDMNWFNRERLIEIGEFIELSSSVKGVIVPKSKLTEEEKTFILLAKSKLSCVSDQVVDVAYVTPIDSDLYDWLLTIKAELQ